MTTGRGALPAYAVAGPRVQIQAARVLVVSHLFPANLQRCVIGAFQRLRLLVEAARAAGTVDMLCFWDTDSVFSGAEIERRYAEIVTAWDIDGTLWLCRIGNRGRPRAAGQSVIDLSWALRGAVSFSGDMPTMSFSGNAQGEVMRIALRKLRPHLIVAHSQTALSALWRANVSLPPIVADFPDIEHVWFNRAAAQASGPADRLRLRAWSVLARALGRLSLRRSRVATVCSEVDRRHLQQLVPEADIRVLPNSVDELPLLRTSDEPVALFVAALNYRPNAEAALWFLDRCWPQVRAAFPGARLVIVGDGEAKLLQRRPPPAGVEFLGFRDSLEGSYAAARLVICPIRRGSGTRIKIIEAAAYGRPVVATTVGAEGLEFADGREILIRDSPEDFAQACIALLADKDAGQTLGRAAQAVARARYGRAAAVTTGSRIFAQAMAPANVRSADEYERFDRHETAD